ncbi:MAG: four helix bundle protein [Candidatus Staskawiczbacteria bacterium]|nr:four helix bundle protein [Candidatus Staskawiczbacteria bacterium]
MNENKTNQKYDLEERTAKFGEDMVDFVKTIEKSEINRPLINQIIRSATSIGANYMEANGAGSKKDFRNKICICKKEARETKYWLRIISKANSEKLDNCRLLWQEAHELTLIFSKIIISSTNQNPEKI